MSNWCRNRLTITGPEADRAAFLERAGEILDFDSWKPYPEHFRKLDEAACEWDRINVEADTRKLRDGVTWQDRPMDGFNHGGNEWCIENWNSKWNPANSHVAPHFVANDECITCGFETPFMPPVAIVCLMSEKFPALTFVLKYSVEMMWDAGEWVVANGDESLREHEVGWFRTAKGHEPVHHYVSAFDVEDAKVKEMIAAKILFQPETATCPGEYAYRCNPAELGLTTYWTLAYTLDEDSYLQSCFDRGASAALWDSKRRGVPGANTAGAILCNCPIRLTEQEIEWLQGTTMPYNDEERKTLAEYPEFASSFIANRTRERQFRHHLYSRHGAQHNFPTTRKELELLLTYPDLNEARRKEIEEAMRSPKWKTDWPQWRDLMPSPPSAIPLAG
jgi:hypothetical protein